ncbi:MAG: hypothetical protein K6C94_05540 [Candidatus Gastranaerophilales bacterium]|nr:hypothetical protein [Candidatus Gastranaerophilales bacterium]
MDFLNGINLYALQSGQVQKTLKKTLCGDEEITEKTEAKAKQTTEMSSKEIFDFMANQASMLKIDVKKTVEIKKLTNTVSTEEYQRIGNIMKDFENSMEQGLQMLDSDFSNLNLSENAKMKIALKSIDKLT